MAIRKVKKKETTLEEKLKTLEEEEIATLKETEKLRKERENFLKSELDAAYYFSVIFETGEERDKWLKEHNIKLMDNDLYCVLAKDFVNKVK